MNDGTRPTPELIAAYRERHQPVMPRFWKRSLGRRAEDWVDAHRTALALFAAAAIIVGLICLYIFHSVNPEAFEAGYF